MQKIRAISCIIVFLIVAGCGSYPNIVPNWGYHLRKCSYSGDLRHDLDDIAVQLGFRHVSGVPAVVMYMPPYGDIKRTDIWELTEHRSTGIGLSQALSSGQYVIGMSDSRTSGFNLKGIACRKYNELGAALKERMGADCIDFDECRDSENEKGG